MEQFSSENGSRPPESQSLPPQPQETGRVALLGYMQDLARQGGMPDFGSGTGTS